MSVDQLIPVNEIFGPTYQGEGFDIGRPVIFVRLHNCPVQCAGCDSFYTWNGTEKPSNMFNSQSLVNDIVERLKTNSNCGIVLSGGEPLLHYRNRNLLQFISRMSHLDLTMETSGYFQPKELDFNQFRALENFVSFFDYITISPKITPCLRGRYENDQLTVNMVNLITATCFNNYAAPHVCFKFVAKDSNDIDAIDAFYTKMKLESLQQATFLPIYIMPFGITSQEVSQTAIELLPMIAKLRFKCSISPRLQVLLWDKKRAV